MIKDKFKRLIFSPTATMVQTLLPIILLLYIALVGLIYSIVLVVPTGIFKILAYIFVGIPVALMVVYPIISFIWCTAHLIHCVRQKLNKFYAVMSLVMSAVVLLADFCGLILLMFIFG